jgi:hypothetical protein
VPKNLPDAQAQLKNRPTTSSIFFQFFGHGFLKFFLFKNLLGAQVQLKNRPTTSSKYIFPFFRPWIFEGFFV